MKYEIEKKHMNENVSVLKKTKIVLLCSPPVFVLINKFTSH